MPWSASNSQPPGPGAPAAPRTHRASPTTTARLIDLYFLEHRARLLDLAAFLDRIERGVDAADPREDFRIAALYHAIAMLDDGRPDRARRILELLSDPSTEPIAAAPGKGAAGAPAPTSASSPSV